MKNTSLLGNLVAPDGWQEKGKPMQIRMPLIEASWDPNQLRLPSFKFIDSNPAVSIEVTGTKAKYTNGFKLKWLRVKITWLQEGGMTPVTDGGWMTSSNK